MSHAKNDESLHHAWQRERQAMAILSSLNYRTGELDRYLHDIACAVSQLMDVDWTVVTICQEGFESVLASSLDMGDSPRVYALHGRLINTVMQNRCTLAVKDAIAQPEYGRPAPGYRAYLGVPLRTAESEMIGTVCSFHCQPREFTPSEIQIVELFAERAATAIDHYHLYQQQRQFNEALEVEVQKRTAELQVAQAKLVEQERLAAIGEFSAMLVHEIRNPFTTMVMGLKYFQKTVPTESAQERLSLALDEASRLERLLNEILMYAKPQILQSVELELNEFIDKLLVTVREMPEAQERQIEFIPASTEVRILGDKDKLKQVFINLIRNACEAVSKGNIIKWKVDGSAPNHVYISVHNGGEPIPPEVLPKLTQPFCSTKSGGTGLGLAITKRIINAHGGELSIQSTSELGTLVSVKLSNLNEHGAETKS
uniref:histidine kinase n=1 Tax=Oscillatoriales cyanobacterium SpSt-402 TaxID=2282168 RepID=A0A832M307_9CYAN